MKKYLLAIVLFIALVSNVSCTKATNKYDFPITREIVEHVLNDKNLGWSIAEEKTGGFQSSFIMKVDEDEYGRFDIGSTAILESIGNDDERYLSAQIIYPNTYSSTQIREQQVENLPLLIDIATELYGINGSSRLIFNEFVKYSDGNIDYENNGLLWEYKVKDTHVLLRMSSLSKGVMHRKLAVFIMNDISYEKYKAGTTPSQ